MEHLDPFVLAQSAGPAGAAIRIGGPWLALASFSVSPATLEGSWRLGPGSPDVFRQARASTATAPGLGRMIFQASCPMGAPLGALASVSSSHPALAFSVGCHGEDGEPQSFWVANGAMELIEPQQARALEARAQAQWAQQDLQTRAWLVGQGSAPENGCWGALAPCGPFAQPWLALEAAKLLANDPSADPGSWARWPEEAKEFWSLAASPWTPRPFWSHGPFVSRHLPAMAGRGDIERPWRQAALRRFAESVARWASVDPQSARECAAQALRDLPPSGAGAGLWRAAALGAPDPFGPVLAQAMAMAQTPLESFFDEEKLAACANEKPFLAAALMRHAPWSPDPERLERLALACPEPAASAAVAKALEGASRSGSESSGRARL